MVEIQAPTLELINDLIEFNTVIDAFLTGFNKYTISDDYSKALEMAQESRIL